MNAGNKLNNLLQKTQSDANSGQCKKGGKGEDRVFPYGVSPHLRVETVLIQWFIPCPYLIQKSEHLRAIPFL